MKARLLGVDFDQVTEREAIARIVDALDRRTGGSVCTVNLEILRLCTRSAEAHSLVRAADIVVADGQPLIWASRLQASPLPERVAGSNLIWTLTAEAAARRRSIFLLGGEPGTAEAAAQRLLAGTPGLRVAGVFCPPLGFESNPEQIEHIRNTLLRTNPDIVYVGLGFPKQEKLIRQVQRDLPATWFVGVGVSISFAAGHVRRAPRWMQESGLEWLHRLAQEPRRLAKRYLLHGLWFAPRLFAKSLRVRSRTRR